VSNTPDKTKAKKLLDRLAENDGSEGEFRLSGYDYGTEKTTEIGSFPSLEAAKKAAQADHESGDSSYGTYTVTGPTGVVQGYSRGGPEDVEDGEDESQLAWDAVKD
jgi:hypothetical protein